MTESVPVAVFLSPYTSVNLEDRTMRTMLIGLFLATLFAGLPLASEPGQPLDCSDWVFLEPGLLTSPGPRILRQGTDLLGGM